jgi:hypothetical protein
VAAGAGATTKPAIRKLKGFSLPSLLVKVMSPDLVPITDVSNCTRNTTELPGATGLNRSATTEKPAGNVREPSVSGAVP